MLHTVHNYLVFVRQGMPKVEPLRLLNLAEGEVEVQLYSLTDAALARMALDNVDEVPEEANTVAVMEDQDHPAREAYAPHLAFDPPERVEGGWQVTLRHPPVDSLPEVVVRDLRGRDIRYAASLGWTTRRSFAWRRLAPGPAWTTRALRSSPSSTTWPARRRAVF